MTHPVKVSGQIRLLMRLQNDLENKDATRLYTVPRIKEYWALRQAEDLCGELEILIIAEMILKGSQPMNRTDVVDMLNGMGVESVEDMTEENEDYQRLLTDICTWAADVVPQRTSTIYNSTLKLGSLADDV